jgi:hypothetical protein
MSHMDIAIARRPREENHLPDLCRRGGGLRKESDGLTFNRRELRILERQHCKTVASEVWFRNQDNVTFSTFSPACLEILMFGSHQLSCRNATKRFSLTYGKNPHSARKHQKGLHGTIMVVFKQRRDIDGRSARRLSVPPE